MPVKINLIIACGWIFSFCSAQAQSKGGVDQYFYSRIESNAPSVMPVAHITTAGNWYGEARYNYDEWHTLSLYGGKTFSRQGRLSAEATPLIGALVGQTTGASMGVNLEMEFENLFFSSQSQYTLSFSSTASQYVFSWSEIGYNATPWLYAGVAFQQTSLYKTTGEWSPGGMVGFSFRNWTIPVYGFLPAAGNTYYVLGVNYRWQSAKRNAAGSQPLVSEFQSTLQH